MEVRKATVRLWASTEPAVLAQHAAVAARLEDSMRFVRCAAVETWAKLDAATLALRAAVVAKLEDLMFGALRRWRLWACIRRTSRSTRLPSSPSSRTRTSVRLAAVQTLVKLDAATRAPLQWLHEAAIREKLAKWDSEERGAALKILRML